MTDFLNPLGRYIGVSGPVPPTAISGTIPDPPRGLRQIDPGTIIKGVVIGRESDGLTSIATDKGTVRVASNTPLPPGTNVTLEVRPTGDRLQVLILFNDAVRPSPTGSPAASPAVAPSPTPNSPGPTPAPAGPGGAANTGTAASGAPPSGPPATNAPPSPGPPAGTNQPPTQPPIQIVGSVLPAIVLQPQPAALQPPAGQQSPAPLQIQLPNGQILTLPLPTQNTAAPAGPPGTQIPPAQTSPVPLPGVPGQPQPGGQPLPATIPAAPTPSTATPPSAQAPVIAAPISRPPMSAVPTSSALSSDVQQRILALFEATPATIASGRPGLAPAILAGATPIVSAEAVAKFALPAGAELHLRVLAVQIGSQHAIEIDPAARLAQGGKDSHIVFGRVIALTPAGHAVIHTPVGDILLQHRSSLPVGAQLALAIDTVEAPPSAPAMVAPLTVQTPQQALLSLSRNWPTLADLVAILQGGGPLAGGKTPGIDPALARELLAHLPQMGSRLGSGILAAMAALRSSDIGRLLGPHFAARGLGADKEDMARRLRGEFTQLSALAQDRPESDWRALFLPYLDDQQRVQRINLFYRRHRKNESGDGDGSGTRFVVEADFTRLGPFQLDGLMRSHRFDLMIRSRQRLDDRMRRDIEAIYEEARGLTGFAGAIAFQTVDEFPVAPLEDLKRGSDKVTI